jgi:hypothetical protein
VRSTTDRNFRILTGVIALLSIVVLVAASDSPRPLRHEQDLGQAKYHHLETPRFASEDVERARTLFKERVRIAYGMAAEEFDGLKGPALRELIGDDTLADFALGEGDLPEPDDLEPLLWGVQKWE